MTSAYRYFHTLRYLKPVQIYGRLWARLYRPRLRHGPPPQLRAQSSVSVGFLQKERSLLAPEKFSFLGVEHEIRSKSDWNNPAWDKLWLYNLHYFDDLNALGADDRRAWHLSLLKRWIEENHLPAGSGWEPYPLSLRVVNWVKWLIRLRSASGKSLHGSLADEAFEDEILANLSVQTRYLRRRLEKHLLGNHLLANAKALVFAGSLFAHEEAVEWLHTGAALLGEQLPEQILDDGGHFELSPMYHSIVLEDLLDLVQVAQIFPDTGLSSSDLGTWTTAASRMLKWLQVMSHPDGEIAFFNDAAFGMSAAPEDLLAYASRLGFECDLVPARQVVRLANCGYVRVQIGSMAAFLDVAAIGPDYLPGHAHADTLSFEMSLFGQRMLINSGVSQYGQGPERLRQRGTAAHNTIVVDGEDSSEVWSSFRVARRAYPVNLQVREGPTEISVSCVHDGYRRLPGKVEHRREWHFGQDQIIVRDTVSGRFERAEARFHFHPACDVTMSQDRHRGTARLPNGEICHWDVSGGLGRLDNTTYHPHFGSSIANRCLAVELHGPEIATTFRWAKAQA